MTAVLLRLRTELRSRWRTWVTLTLILGLFGGAVIAIAAGARRTDSAYPRFLAWSHAPDVEVPRFNANVASGAFGLVTLKDVEALPQVADSAHLRIYQATGDVTANAPADSRYYSTFGRLKFVQGRFPRTADDVALNWLQAGLTALVVLLVLSQTLARMTYLESGENPTLSSIGMTRSQLLGVALSRVALVAVGGAFLAVVIAALASPLFPTGTARVAEPYPGFHFDFTALGLGALAILVIVAMLSAVPAWRAATLGARGGGVEGEKPSHVAAAVARAGIPASGAAGVRMALEPGRGRTAVPVRTAIAGVTIGVGAVTAAPTFGSSLNHLLDTPRLYGVTWNVQAYANVEKSTRQTEQDLVSAVRGVPGVTSYGLGTVGLELTVNGQPADSVAVYNRQGGVEPPILQGRAPSKAAEIALGSKTLAELHKSVGDTVDVGVFIGTAKPMKVVGVAVTPPVGDVGQFGKGGLIDYRSTQYLVPGAPAADTLLVRTAPGVDPQAVGAAIARRNPDHNDIEISLPTQPTDLVNFGRVQNFPLYLGLLIALMAAATLAHVLVSSIRRRRRDLAILKTIGFQRRQLTSTVAWQASTLSVVALLVGIPVGIAVGRWIWSAFSNQLGIIPSPALPLLGVLLTIPATLLLANLIAFVPGRAAARVKAATVLRTE